MREGGHHSGRTQSKLSPPMQHHPTPLQSVMEVSSSHLTEGAVLARGNVAKDRPSHVPPTLTLLNARIASIDVSRSDHSGGEFETTVGKPSDASSPPPAGVGE